MFQGFLNTVSNSRYTAHHLNVIPSATVQQIDFPLFPLISLAVGIDDLKDYLRTKNCALLLSCIALLSTDGIYCYQKFIAGSASSSCLLYVGLAVSDGVKMIAAVNALCSEWSQSNEEQRKKLILNAVTQVLFFCSWIAFALGVPTAGLLLIGCAIAASIIFNCCSLIRVIIDPSRGQQIAEHDHLNGAPASRDQLYANHVAPDQRPANAQRTFVPFSGTGNRLGGAAVGGN